MVAKIIRELINSSALIVGKLICKKNREGLIRSRIKATNAAKGEVLVFLDSHCEVEPGWLEPLLVRILDNPKRFVCPVIENIRYTDYGFVKSERGDCCKV